jgi:hypothetical protein
VIAKVPPGGHGPPSSFAVVLTRIVPAPCGMSKKKKWPVRLRHRGEAFRYDKPSAADYLASTMPRAREPDRPWPF